MASGLNSVVFPTTAEPVEGSAENGIPCHSICASPSFKGCNEGSTRLDESGLLDAGDGMGRKANQISVAEHKSPGYESYDGGFLGGADGQCVSELPCFMSAEYGRHPLPCGAKAVSSYMCNAIPGTANSGSCLAAGMKTNSSKYTKANCTSTHKFPLSSNSKSCQPFGSHNISRPTSSLQPYKPHEKAPQSGYNFQSVSQMKPYYPAGEFSSPTYQEKDPTRNTGPMGYRADGRTWYSDDRFKSRVKSRRNSDHETSAKLACGPRAQNASSNPSPVQEQLHPTLRKDQYNLVGFPTQYESAKFFVIKSYSEENVHKCIKYDVWSSTLNGNKKLDAAFHDAEVKTSELGSKCPVFLFFSVNGSGQFVGLAEMTGKVDFQKDMDFWQFDKWNGFFPVKWHIIKDIPNSHLRHILLENNDNRPVTYTRDTQEIDLKPGLEMLKIFKNYSAKTSLLDDFCFYEVREKENGKMKSTSSQMDICRDSCWLVHSESGMYYGDQFDYTSVASEPVSSLVNLTKNLSISSKAQD
ncbi:hypothetical protein Nepgr_016843 [Nepenthes gracilis]|uniref:YTH domain-containing family protein n=1 Tax=Nepenthes gracilis TaxID=150966 RepID=A0AAD3SRA0_NEPGR|nr:hypothetical protein Nepgr_016843 [Nepenthes gracilis]